MNYIAFGGGFWLHYAYIDSNNYTLDSLFYRHKVPVKFGDEFCKAGEPFRIIFCKIRRKYKAEFEKALSEASNKMALAGHRGYDEFCEMFLKEVKDGIKE